MTPDTPRPGSRCLRTTRAGADPCRAPGGSWRGALDSRGLSLPSPPLTPRVADWLPPGRRKTKGESRLARLPRSHTIPRGAYFFVESAGIDEAESIDPPPIAVLSELFEDDSAAGGVCSAFLPQPAAKDARAKAISVRAKSLRIVCTFTSSHAAAPEIPRFGRAHSHQSVRDSEKNTTGSKRCRVGRVHEPVCGCGRSRWRRVNTRQHSAKTTRRLGTNPPLVKWKLARGRLGPVAEADGAKSLTPGGSGMGQCPCGAWPSRMSRAAGLSGSGFSPGGGSCSTCGR